ncbi:MAG: hypothetical protein KDB79_08905 [Acidobacteria bacterium]|nr:hypothetical protein [Acidobacteriota bacterium]
MDELTIEFSSTIREVDLFAKFTEVVFSKVSRTFQDEGYYLIGEANLSKIRYSELIKLGYCFEGNLSDNQDYFYFSLEGDICIDVVSLDFRLLELPN